MNRATLKVRVQAAIRQLIAEKGYVSALDVMLHLDKIRLGDVEKWRLGKIPYLELVVQMNLSQINALFKEMQIIACATGLKSSMTVYRTWGRRARRPLQFSKSGHPYSERRWSTHFVRSSRGNMRSDCETNSID